MRSLLGLVLVIGCGGEKQDSSIECGEGTYLDGETCVANMASDESGTSGDGSSYGDGGTDDEADGGMDDEADGGTDEETDTADNTSPEGTPDIDIIPAVPTTYDDLDCLLLRGATDPDEDPVHYTFSWAVDGEVFTESTTWIAAESTEPDQEWTCTITPADGSASGTANSASVTIFNSAPTAPEVRISPAVPTVDSDLYCEVTGESFDAEGDSINYTYRWTKDGVETDITDATVPASATEVPNEWTCTVTPNDGWVDGPSSTATIALTACQSLYFDGTDDRVVIPADPALDIGNDPSARRTIEGWYLSDSTAAQVMVAKPGEVAGTSGQDYSVYLHDSTSSFNWATAYAGIDSCTNFRVSRPEVGEWHHFAVTLTADSSESGTKEVYIDGNLAGACDYTGKNPATTEYEMVLGGTQEDGVPVTVDHFAGYLSEIRISSTVRYTADFTPETRLTSDDDTIALWRLSEGMGSTATDSSSHGHDGEIQGATWVTECPE